jgi:acyl-CoA synthetase (AMP-forming)/AMP-acid ligase II
MTRRERLLHELSERGDRECLVAGGEIASYADLDRRRTGWISRLKTSDTKPGRVIGVKADFSLDSIALLLALLSCRNVAALLPQNEPADDPFLQDSRAEAVWRQDENGSWSYESLTRSGDHPLLASLRERQGAGLVIFSSGSTGRAKAILHDVDRFLRKYETPGKGMRTLAFLLFDHVAGMDTLFYTLCNGGSLVLPEGRDPRLVSRLIEEHQIEVLPASPTFLNLFCLARADEGRDLTSLKIITYGSEPMSQEALDRVGSVFPEARLIQKYGTSEYGSPRSMSRDRSSLWINLKADELETRIVDGILWLRSDAAMLGYLNAANPFDEDGWYCTGDRVEQEGDWIRILGRESEIINVGGEKVFPAEVESVIQELDWVDDVVVRAMNHPLTGQVVEAIVNLQQPREARDVRKAVRSHCRARLPGYKVPVRVLVTPDPLTSARHKKHRRSASA